MSNRVLAIALASVLALIISAPAAQAEESVCRGTIGVTTVDNHFVPQGATCTLNGTKVEGTARSQRCASSPPAAYRVKGNVQSEGFRYIALRENSRVGRQRAARERARWRYRQGARLEGQRRPPVRRQRSSDGRRGATRSSPISRPSRTLAGWCSRTTGSPRTCSASRITRPQPVVATPLVTRKASAPGSSLARRSSGSTRRTALINDRSLSR